MYITQIRILRHRPLAEAWQKIRPNNGSIQGGRRTGRFTAARWARPRYFRLRQGIRDPVPDCIRQQTACGPWPLSSTPTPPAGGLSLRAGHAPLRKKISWVRRLRI